MRSRNIRLGELVESVYCQEIAEFEALEIVRSWQGMPVQLVDLAWKKYHSPMGVKDFRNLLEMLKLFHENLKPGGIVGCYGFSIIVTITEDCENREKNLSILRLLGLYESINEEDLEDRSLYFQHFMGLRCYEQPLTIGKKRDIFRKGWKRSKKSAYWTVYKG